MAETANLTSFQEPVCVAPVGDRCGEGPLWHPSEQALYWTDINRFLVHRLDSKEHAVKSWFFDEPVTALALTENDDTLAVALGSRLIFWKPMADERRDHGFHLNRWPKVRLNDGGVDPRGSLWVGSMRNNVNPDGSSGEAGGLDGILFCIDVDGRVSEWKKDVGISNTFAWSPNRKHFYFGDTLANIIWTYEYDETTGAVSDERVFFQGFERGLPDGSAVDGEGYLWNCRYSGGCIVRVAADGSVDRIVEMPVRNVTSCAFGGGDYKTLYITTAAGSAGERLGGSLFALRTDSAGQPAYRCRLQA